MCFRGKEFNLNPLGDSQVLAADTRGDVTKTVTLSYASALPDERRDFASKWVCFTCTKSRKGVMFSLEFV